MRTDLLAYVPAAVTTTVAAMAGRDRIHLVSKLALAPTLAAGVAATRSTRPRGRTTTLLAALGGSLVGDWFMYRSGQTEGATSRQQMRLGASAFAVQQVGLIRTLLRDGARPQPVPSAAAAGVMGVLAVLDSDGGGLPDPVLGGYGVLLGSMSALAMGEGGPPRPRRGVALGGALFLLSDAAIIVGQQYATTPRRRMVADGVILSTYTAALALLVHGLRD
ncbi:lysoplasmalogenase family protein [Janibacter cremeus]|uniref:Putative membrane protein YhhN n=1 Tax=Janibacter cremeus TaxID=1285192 RepID=A0A852W049_9MICO|nr:lysoplasmalogenase family protein [Janibacter cremeus]NYF99355.1 putative membrane protein YhhN [Janibacter cremeus]